MVDISDLPTSRNLVELFLNRADAKGAVPFLWAKRGGAWQSISWADAARQVRSLLTDRVPFAVPGAPTTERSAVVLRSSGSTGVSGGFHIHFEVKLNGTRLDPLQFFTNYTTAW